MITIEDIPLMPRWLSQPMYPAGIPLHYNNPAWQGRNKELVVAAVRRYFDLALYPGITPLTTDEIDILRQFLMYFIYAPCWASNVAHDQEMTADLNNLRSFAGKIVTIEEIHEFIHEAATLGLDPF